MTAAGSDSRRRSPASAGPSPAIPTPPVPPSSPLSRGRSSTNPCRPCALAGQKGLVAETKADPDEFPLPFAAGGGRPKGATSPRNPRLPERTPTSVPGPREQCRRRSTGRPGPRPPALPPCRRRVTRAATTRTRMSMQWSILMPKNQRQRLRTRPRRNPRIRSISTRRSFSAPSRSGTRIASRYPP